MSVDYTYSYLLGSMPAGSAGYRTAAAAARTSSTPNPVLALHSRYGAGHRCTDFLFRNRHCSHFCSGPWLWEPVWKALHDLYSARVTIERHGPKDAAHANFG